MSNLIMNELQSLLIFAQEETLWDRLGIWIGPIILGIILILMGRFSIKKQAAQKEKTVGGTLLGQRDSFAGLDAVQMGWLRIWAGIFVIGMGIYQLFK